MKQKITWWLIPVLWLMNWAGTGTSPLLDHQPWQNKVDDQVLTAAQTGDTEFLVVLKDQADLSPAGKFQYKSEKGAYVYQNLSNIAASTQKPIREILDSSRAEYQSFWVVNMLWVRGDSVILQNIAQREEVDKIVPNTPIRISLPEATPEPALPHTLDAVEWNIRKINAPAVWALGYTGAGIVIGGQDTGFEWDHPALKEQYRGWNGISADHNYNWHDTVTSGGGICGANTLAPCDDYGHGTHTMGTMVGDDGGINRIGVAPGARWMGCRNMNQGYGTPASYAECYQWFIAPTDLKGTNPDPSKAPHVINNSWSCPIYEGCIEPGILLTVVQSVRAAGIVTVHSAGNSGSACFTVDEPASIYEESFTIGATDQKDIIATFSSRGSVAVDGSYRLKPNVAAPGVSIRSSTLNDSYGFSSGTSMAAPHVAGLVALLLSANPGLIGQVDRIEEIIETSALPRISAQDCGEVPGNVIPNNTYGWGRVDALTALWGTLDIFYFPVIFR